MVTQYIKNSISQSLFLNRKKNRKDTLGELVLDTKINDGLVMSGMPLIVYLMDQS